MFLLLALALLSTISYADGMVPCDSDKCVDQQIKPGKQQTFYDKLWKLSKTEEQKLDVLIQADGLSCGACVFTPPTQMSDCEGGKLGVGIPSVLTAFKTCMASDAACDIKEARYELALRAYNIECTDCFSWYADCNQRPTCQKAAALQEAACKPIELGANQITSDPLYVAKDDYSGSICPTDCLDKQNLLSPDKGDFITCKFGVYKPAIGLQRAQAFKDYECGACTDYSGYFMAALNVDVNVNDGTCLNRTKNWIKYLPHALLTCGLQIYNGSTPDRKTEEFNKVLAMAQACGKTTEVNCEGSFSPCTASCTKKWLGKTKDAAGGSCPWETIPYAKCMPGEGACEADRRSVCKAHQDQRPCEKEVAVGGVKCKFDTGSGVCLEDRSEAYKIPGTTKAPVTPADSPKTPSGVFAFGVFLTATFSAFLL